MGGEGMGGAYTRHMVAKKKNNLDVSHFLGVILSALGMHISIVPNNKHSEASRK